MIVYDAEIIRMVKPDGPHDERWVEGLEYCKGWDDFPGMGISCLCAIELTNWRPWVFMADNLARFEHLAATHKVLCGWNNRRFDNELLEAHGICLPWERTWDLQEELAKAADGGPVCDDNYRELARGRSLDAAARANLDDGGKSGPGWMAPVDWQAGRIGRVVSYCLNDVHQTALLARRIIQQGGLIDPVTGLEVEIGMPDCR